ncbi:MAG: hypothetical protein IJI60_01145 [Bacilli bacterium]|nr:hypothetical protein [Bacilli bacterium]
MYSISSRKYINNGKLLDKTDVLDIGGFLVATKRKVFQIQGANVRKIRVVDKDLAHPLVHEVVMRKYQQLISVLAELLVEDDDDGETCREALNQIERFRIQVKNKYRNYVKKQELERMSKKLSKIQKEMQMKLFMIQNSYLRYPESNRRGR